MISTFPMDIQDIFTNLHIQCYSNKISILDMYGYMWIHMDVSWISHGNLLGYPCKISTQDIHLGYVTIYLDIWGSTWICHGYLMEICKDICTRYLHKISMFGYVVIHGYMEIHMDNIGYLIDISFGYLFWISPSRRAKRYPCIRTYPYLSMPLSLYIHISLLILIYPNVQVPICK